MSDIVVSSSMDIELLSAWFCPVCIYLSLNL